MVEGHPSPEAAPYLGQNLIAQGNLHILVAENTVQALLFVRYLI
jgi:hypothetical protein